jgi:hypothetical protein
LEAIMQRKRLNGKSLVATLRLLLGIALAAGGCAYETGYYQKAVIKKPLKSAPADPQIIRGRENLVLDGLGHYVFSMPAKLSLWNWSVGRHRVSAENEQIIRQYLAVNGLSTVEIRLNTYAPHKEFARLKKNKDVHAGYKYSIGALSVLFYTLLPDRLFAGLIGGDHYNPYTNTVHIYSDHSAILVHEAGHAKDFAGRSMRGSYAFARMLPYVDLQQEMDASTDVIDYFYCRGDETNELNAYPILMPAYATYLGKYLFPGVDLATLVYAHIYSRYYRNDRREQLAVAPEGLARGECWGADEVREDGSAK